MVVVVENIEVAAGVHMVAVMGNIEIKEEEEVEVAIVMEEDIKVVITTTTTLDPTMGKMIQCHLQEDITIRMGEEID